MYARFTLHNRYPRVGDTDIVQLMGSLWDQVVDSDSEEGGSERKLQGSSLLSDLAPAIRPRLLVRSSRVLGTSHLYLGRTLDEIVLILSNKEVDGLVSGVNWLATSLREVSGIPPSWEFGAIELFDNGDPAAVSSGTLVRDPRAWATRTFLASRWRHFAAGIITVFSILLATLLHFLSGPISELAVWTCSALIMGLAMLAALSRLRYLRRNAPVVQWHDESSIARKLGSP